MEKTNAITAEAGIQMPAPTVSGEVDKIIEESSVEGLNGAMILFAQKRGFSLDDPKTVRFAQCITAEFGFGKEGELYPLSKSIAEPVREALRQGRGTFLQLYAGGEEQNLRKLIRVIVSGEALNVMQDKLEEVMKFYHELK